MNQINIRTYQNSDASPLWQLKFNTIRRINSRDYQPDQVQAWAPEHISAELWQKRADAMAPFIAEINGEIVGFADLQADGYIDHFFCHAEHQGQGVGKALMDHIFTAGKEAGIARLYANVSITARPFFEHFGFRVLKQQQAEINGRVLTNFLMEHHIG
ncbi:GNAT family N-acetyltransferase [Reinekea marinisedimentorum]|uniref:Putative acetyltransferase n=1 Tax=Reinekea marinisedimentorum TaxID=230495 RepID=A0A4R3IAW2_9GAMM|nr:GNAT family N-acetyltransferase [Reinekea marinisedimentorum]TCS43729.1 putative acetyltransferase [Reinekea marinisedimentorum]